MRDRLDELGTDTHVALVTFTEPEHLDGYLRRNRLPFPVLRDPDRVTYRAFGLGRGRLTRIWGWRSLRRYVELLRTDGLGALARPTEDTRQLGGDFVIDPDGRIAWAFRGDGPDDRPSVDQLVAAVDGTARRRPGGRPGE